ncbi:MAG: Bug family tripartite tricarboxylate transporter substrate binding protein, partial [Limnohabitans sp.]
MNTSRRKIVLALTASSLPFSIRAQSYPSKPITIVVPFVAGGGADAVARMIATQLQKTTGQAVVVDNKPGAGGALAAEAVTRAAADGYTLLIATNSLLTNSAITKTRYDIQRDFTAISTLGTSPYLLLSNTSAPFKSVSDIVRMGKSQPDKLSFGSAGQGSITHLLGELTKQQAAFTAQHIPYKGTGAALLDLLGGQIDFAFADTASAMPHLKAGKLRALATTGPARSPQLNDVPTTREVGLDMSVVGFYGLLAPAGLSPSVLARLNGDVTAILATNEVKDRFAALLTDASSMTSDKFTQLLASEQTLWRDV